jgi:hypothetical protein
MIKDGISEGVWDNNIIPEDFALLYTGILITFNVELILNKDEMKMESYCKRMYNLILKSLKR